MSPLPLPPFLVFFASLFVLPMLLVAAPTGAPELQEGQQSSVQDIAQPFAPAGNGNETEDGALGVYFCTSAFWNAVASADAACSYNSNAAASATSSSSSSSAVTDPCVRLRATTAAAQGKPYVSYYRNVGSFAPDAGIVCEVFDADDCDGASLRITSPGFADLGVVGWARRVASYACVASASTASTTTTGGGGGGGGNWFVDDGNGEDGSAGEQPQ